jgi:hypothetical protein
MSKHHKPRDTIFVVVRHDTCQSSPEHQFTVKEALWEEAAAAAEAERLNGLNAGKAAHYFVRATRLFPPGTSAGSGDPSTGPARNLVIEGRRYFTVVASDVINDGLALELYEGDPSQSVTEGGPLLDAFRSDGEGGRLTFSAYREDLPVALIEAFLDMARQELAAEAGEGLG